jgi:type 1 fimbriae regulatory protein FimB
MGKNSRIRIRAKRKPHAARHRPLSQRPIKFLSRDQVEQFFVQIPATNVRDLLLFDLMYRHGLRRGEAALLEIDDVQGDDIWIARLKGGEAHWHPLHRRSKRLLRAYLQVRPADPCPYLFRGRFRTEEPLTEGAISYLFQLYAEAAGIPLSLRHTHALRHSCGTHLARAHWDLADVKWWLGHKDIKSTEIYFQGMPERIAEKYRVLLRSRGLARTGGFN